MVSLRKLSITALVLGMTCTLTSIASAQAGSESGGANLKAWDTDHDGTVDSAEAKKAAEAKFDSLDTDHDGTLDMKEMTGTGVHEMTFKKADMDKDGTID
jgi:hypothetical protein